MDPKEAELRLRVLQALLPPSQCPESILANAVPEPPRSLRVATEAEVDTDRANVDRIVKDIIEKERAMDVRRAGVQLQLQQTKGALDRNRIARQRRAAKRVAHGSIAVSSDTIGDAQRLRRKITAQQYGAIISRHVVVLGSGGTSALRTISTCRIPR